MNRQRIAALLIAAVSLTGIAATPALAHGKAPARAAKAHAAKGTAAQFAVVGKLTAKAAGAVTVTAWHKRRAVAVTATVPANAKVVRNGKRVGLDALQVNDKVVLVGKRVGTALTAYHVNAKAPGTRPKPSTSASPSATPVAEPTSVATAPEPTS